MRELTPVESFLYSLPILILAMLAYDLWDYQPPQEKLVVQQSATTHDEEPYLTYDHLSNGHYEVVAIVNPHDGTAVLRQFLPHDDVDVLVTNVPQGMLTGGSRHQVLRF